MTTRIPVPLLGAAFLLAASLAASSAPDKASPGDKGTVRSANCGSFTAARIFVQWDNGKSTDEPCTPNLMGGPAFAPGDRVTITQAGFLARISTPAPAPAPKPAPMPAPAALEGAVTGIVVTVKLDNGTTRDFHYRGVTGGVNIGDRVVATGDDVRRK